MNIFIAVPERCEKFKCRNYRTERFPLQEDWRNAVQ